MRIVVNVHVRRSVQNVRLVKEQKSVSYSVNDTVKSRK